MTQQLLNREKKALSRDDAQHNFNMHIQKCIDTKLNTGKSNPNNSTLHRYLTPGTQEKEINITRPFTPSAPYSY